MNIKSVATVLIPKLETRYQYHTFLYGEYVVTHAQYSACSFIWRTVPQIGL